DAEDPGIERMNSRVGRPINNVAADRAADALKPDAVSAGIEDLAIADPNIAGILKLYETAALRQRPTAAFEQQACERDVIDATPRQQRGTLREDQPRRTSNPKYLRTGRQLKIAGEVNAGPKHQRDAGTGCVIDCALQ